MSSTEKPESLGSEAHIKALAKAFFEHRIVPAAERIHARGRTFFPLSWDDSETFFSKVQNAPGGVLAPAVIDAATLQRMWAEDPELASLAAPLIELSAEARSDVEQSPDVSPLMYVMF